MNNTREAKCAWWASHIQAWKASGEAQSGYCRQHQTNLISLCVVVQT